MSDDNDAFLGFKDDYQEALEQLNSALLALEDAPGNREALDSASRQLHNIKGFAGRVQASKLEQLAHMLEDLLAAVATGRLQFTSEVADVLFQGMDIFVEFLRRGDIPDAKLTQVVATVEETLFMAGTTDEVKAELQDLIPDFIAAASDNVGAINEGLNILERDPGNRAALQEVYRHAHSLKGSAFTMGFQRLGKLAHQMEEVLRGLAQGELTVSPEVCDALFEANDAISVMLDTLASGGRRPVNVEAALHRLAAVLPAAEEDSSRPTEEADTLPRKPGQGEPPAAEMVAASRPLPAITPPVDTVRVPTASLDELVNLAGEAHIAHMRLQEELGQLLGQYESRRIRLGDSNGAGERKDGLDKEWGERQRRLQEAAEYCGRIIDALQKRALKVRMLPLSLVFNALPRMVRDLGRQVGKQVELIIKGEETTLDKRILEQIGDPLIHLLRNCLDHGIEPPEERRRQGKPPTGRIRLRAYQEGARIVISIEDDGRGIDPARVKEAAVRHGLLARDQAATLEDEQALDLIFLPGFSTSLMVTEISGRGVGLDVVRDNVNRLEGEVRVFSEVGRGTRFLLSLPATLATIHALVVDVGGNIVAVPATSVVRAMHLHRSALDNMAGIPTLVDDDGVIAVRYLAAALGWPDLVDQEKDTVLLLVLEWQGRRAAFVVDEIIGEREIVTKDIGAHLRRLSLVAGAAILGSGEIVLILNVPGIFAAESEPRRIPAPRQGPPPSSEAPLILVVEDQVVTRQMEQSILEAAGYRVVTAENGLDALAKLAEHRVSLVVTDIQMPKMDGFELTEQIRATPATKELPVIVVTSLDREEDRLRGLEVGADAYLVKSNFDQRHLVETIETLLGGRR